MTSIKPRLKSLSLIACSMASLLAVTALSTTAVQAHGDNSPAHKPSQRLEVGGINHLGLSVSSLANSETFFTQTLNFKVLGRDASYPSVFLGNGDVVITLWQVKDPKTATPFNRRNNVGLHHVAFDAKSFENLNALHEALKKTPGVVIEFAPESLGGGPSKHMMIREPSGNRVEFIYRPKS